MITDKLHSNFTYLGYKSFCCLLDTEEGPGYGSHGDSGCERAGAVAASLPCEVPVWTTQDLMATTKERLKIKHVHH